MEKRITDPGRFAAIPGVKTLPRDAGSLGVLGLPLSYSRLDSCTLSDGLDLDSPAEVMTPLATRTTLNNTSTDVFTLLLSQLQQCHNQQVTELEQRIAHLKRRCHKLEDLVKGRGEVAQKYRQTCQKLKQENRSLKRYIKEQTVSSLTSQRMISSSLNRGKTVDQDTQDDPQKDVNGTGSNMMSRTTDSSKKSRLARKKVHKRVRYAEITTGPEEMSHKASQRLKASIEAKLLVPETMDPDMYDVEPDQMEDGCEDDSDEGDRRYPLMGENQTHDYQGADREGNSRTSEISKKLITDLTHVGEDLRTKDNRTAREGVQKPPGERNAHVDEAVVESDGYPQEASTPLYTPSRIGHRTRAMDLSPVILEGLDDTADGERNGTHRYSEMSPTFAGHNQVPADLRNNSPLQGGSVRQRLDHTSGSETSHLMLPQKDSPPISHEWTDSPLANGGLFLKDSPANSKEGRVDSPLANGGLFLKDSPANSKEGRVDSPLANGGLCLKDSPANSKEGRVDSPLANGGLCLKDSPANSKEGRVDSPLANGGLCLKDSPANSKEGRVDSPLANRTDIMQEFLTSRKASPLIAGGGISSPLASSRYSQHVHSGGIIDSPLARKAVILKDSPADSLKSSDMKRKVSPLERRSKPSKLARLSEAEPSGRKRRGIRREFTTRPDLNLLENQSKLRQSTLSQHLVPVSETTGQARDPFKVPAVPPKVDKSSRSMNEETDLSLSLNGSVDPVMNWAEYGEDSSASDRFRSPEKIQLPHLVTPDAVAAPDDHERSEVVASGDKSDLMFEDSVEDLQDSCTPPTAGIKTRDLGELNNFDRVPKKDAGPQYKHKEVVRKRDEREKLKGFDCKQCAEFYGGMGLTDTQKEDRMKACSRHRGRFTPPSTPEHYWSIDFPDTPTCVKRGYILEDVNSREDDKAMPRRRNKLKQLFKN